MPDFGKIAGNLLALAEQMVPIVAGPAGVAAVGAAKAVIALIDDTKDALNETDQATLQGKRDALEAAVMAHADRTIDSLD